MNTVINTTKGLLFLVLINSGLCFAQIDEKNKETMSYKKAIEAVNEVFLKKIFISNYMNNREYFIKTDLSNDDPTADLLRANVLLNSMSLTLSGDSLLVCKKAIDFNENYMSLFDIRKTGVLNAKYNKPKVDQTLNNINKLSILDKGSKLDNTKAKIRNYIESYLAKTTTLKGELEKLKKPDQANPIVKQQYLLLEKKYAEYPYLVKVIQETKSGKNTYITELDTMIENITKP